MTRYRINWAQLVAFVSAIAAVVFGLANGGELASSWTVALPWLAWAGLSVFVYVAELAEADQ